MPPRPRDLERAILLGVVLAWLVTTGIIWLLAPPLGHDEAAYAIEGQRLLAGEPLFWSYRPDGMRVLAALGVAAGGSAWDLRLVNLFLGAGAVVGVWAVGRVAFDRTTGLWAAALIAGAHPMVLRGAELLNDLPSLACILVAIAVLVTELERADGPRWRIAAAAPLLAAAFHLRYGSAPAIALVAVAALAVWWRPILRRPMPCVGASLLFGALLAPHFIRSYDLTGHAFDVFLNATTAPRRAFVGEGLATYFTANPLAYFGALVGPVAIAGLVAIVRPPTDARPAASPAPPRRAARYLAIVAVGQLLAIGLASHAQPRYVFPALALLVVIGVDGLRRFAPARHRRLAGRIAAAAVALAWLGATIAAPLVARHRARIAAPMLAAAAAIRADARGRPCVVYARNAPPLSWYTGCAPWGVHWHEPVARDPTRVEYAVSLLRGPVDVAAFAADRVATPLATGRDDVVLLRVDP